MFKTKECLILTLLHKLRTLKASLDSYNKVHKLIFPSNCSEGGEDVRVTSILDGENANTVETTRGSTEFNVGAVPVEDFGAGESSEILKFGLADSRAVGCDDHELGVCVSESLLGELVANLVLAGSDNESKLLAQVFRLILLLYHVDIPTSTIAPVNNRNTQEYVWGSEHVGSYSYAKQKNLSRLLLL